MNTQSKILLDKIFAKTAAFLLNIIVRIVGKILSIDHNLDKEFKTIAISKFKGLGSILQSTPMIHAIRQRYPDAEIIYVTTPVNKALLEKIDWIDTIILVDDSGFFKFIQTNITALLQLIKKRPEIYFDLEIYSDYSTLFTTFTLAKNRVGFYLRSSSFRLGIYTHMMFYNSRVPASQIYLQLTKLINCDTDSATFYDFSNYGEPRSNQYIVINPNSSDLREERRWEKSKFIELTRRILNELPEYEVLLIGSKGEASYVNEISDAINHPRLINTAGKTTLKELISIISHTSLLITNDTGPMHLAFCAKSPTVCLYGPSAPEKYVMNDATYIIYHRLYCSPCVHDFEFAPCNGDNQCMKLIQVQEVFDQVLLAIQKEKPQTLYKNPPHILNQEKKVFGIINR
ncbi:glycosyltransferase family 9 protein [bacterium SCSIO 12643]|nr:glycosyltransferase family 9 protein [bacterium SCSIO 12643]